MSEMTATRIGAATLAAAWIAAAVVLWRSVPAGPEVAQLDPSTLFPAGLLARNARYADVLTALWLAGGLSQLAALVLLVRRPPRFRGHRLVQAALTGAVVYASVYTAALPARAAAHWWRRRSDVTDLGYPNALLGTWTLTLGELALATVTAVALVAVGRLLGRRAWLLIWPAFAVLATLFILVLPGLLAPRFEPLRDRKLAAQIQALAEREGLGRTEVVIRKAKERTRAVNAEALGVGPTTRVVLWDTLLEPEVGRGEILFVSAHELAHVARHHTRLGLWWFWLLSLPVVWLLVRLVRLGDPHALPRAALLLLVFQLALLPVANAISRRYERQADRDALALTADPAAAEALFRRFARVNLTDPDPPWLLHALLGTHPTLVERISLSRGAAPPGDPGSP